MGQGLQDFATRRTFHALLRPCPLKKLHSSCQQQQRIMVLNKPLDMYTLNKGKARSPCDSTLWQYKKGLLLIFLPSLQKRIKVFFLGNCTSRKNKRPAFGEGPSRCWLWTDTDLENFKGSQGFSTRSGAYGGQGISQDLTPLVGGGSSRFLNSSSSYFPSSRL